MASISFYLTAGAVATVTVTSTAFQPRLVLFRPPGFVLFFNECAVLFPLTADTTNYKADSTLLKADATRLSSLEIVTTTFVAPTTGLWVATITACDGGCGGFNFTVHCPS